MFEYDASNCRTHLLQKVHREEQREKVMEIAQQENIPVIHCNEVGTSNTQYKHRNSIEEELLRDNPDYLDKIELGKHIASIIDKGIVREESLTRIRKEAQAYLSKAKATNRYTYRAAPTMAAIVNENDYNPI